MDVVIDLRRGAVSLFLSASKYHRQTVPAITRKPKPETKAYVHKKPKML